MRSFPLMLLLLAAACDPGAEFTLVDRTGTVTWPAAGDSVQGRVDAGVFTVGLTFSAKLDAPDNLVLSLDSADVAIYDANGVSLQLDGFTTTCEEVTPPAPHRTRWCASGHVSLHSTNYRRLDSLTVRFGYANTKERRVPFTARFVRLR